MKCHKVGWEEGYRGQQEATHSAGEVKVLILRMHLQRRGTSMGILPDSMGEQKWTRLVEWPGGRNCFRWTYKGKDGITQHKVPRRIAEVKSHVRTLVKRASVIWTREVSLVFECWRILALIICQVQHFNKEGIFFINTKHGITAVFSPLWFKWCLVQYVFQNVSSVGGTEFSAVLGIVHTLLRSSSG